MAQFNLYDYEIIEQLGVGGMAKVYIAKQIKLDRLVVIKELSPALYKDPSFRERFAREAKICAKLSHPNIVQIFDVVVKEDGSYLAIEYIDGGDLEELLKKPIEIVTVYQLVKEMCSALDYAHSKNIIHRDVKPKNILVRSNGSFVLADFGIAKSSDMETQMTVVGTTVGSPKYMSPEQAQGHQVDGRSDFYSLGVVLYEVLTGHVPFNADSSVAIALKHMNEDVPPLPENLAELNPFFCKILAKKPENRFSNGQEIVDSFLKWLHQANVSEVTRTAKNESRITEIYSNSLLSKISQINKALPEKNRFSARVIGIVTISAAIIITSTVYYSIKANGVSEQKYINEQLSSAYSNLQNNKLAESLLNFRNVLAIDEYNEVAKKSIGIGKKLLIEDLNKHLASSDFSYIDTNLKVLTNEFLEEPDFSEFLIKYQSLKLQKESQDKLTEDFGKFVELYNQSVENENLVSPKQANAAHYLNRILELKPGDEYYLEQKKTLSGKALEQIKNVFRVLGAAEAKKILDAYSEYFSSDEKYEKVKSQVVQSHEAEEKKQRDLKLAEQKKNAELSELKRLILSESPNSPVSYRKPEYFKNVDSYIELGGSEQEVLKVVLYNINMVIDELASIYVDDFDVGFELKSYKYDFIEGNKYLRQDYMNMLSSLSSLRDSAIRYKNVANVLFKDVGARNSGTIDIVVLGQNVNSLQKLKISPQAISNLRSGMIVILKKGIAAVLENKDIKQAKIVLPLAKQYLSKSDTEDFLLKMQKIEDEAQNLALDRDRVKKEALDKFDRLLKSGALFTSSGASAAEYLKNQMNTDTLSRPQIELAVENLYQHVGEQLSVLIEQRKFQQFNELYTSVESYFGKLPVSPDTQAKLLALKNRRSETERALLSELQDFKTAVKTFEILLRNEELDSALTSFIELDSKYRNAGVQEYTVTLVKTEKSLLTLLYKKIDRFILSSDKRSAEELYKKSLLLFPRDSELLAREAKIRQLKDKEIKILSF